MSHFSLCELLCCFLDCWLLQAEWDQEYQESCDSWGLCLTASNMPTCFGHAWYRKNYNLEPSFNMIQLLQGDFKKSHKHLTPGNAVAAKTKSGSSLRRSRHHHGNLAVKHVHHKNAKTSSVSCSNPQTVNLKMQLPGPMPTTVQLQSNYLQKTCFIQIYLNGSFNLTSPLLPGGTAEEYLQILGQLLTSCLGSCQPSHVPVRNSILHQLNPKLGCWATPHTLDSW